MCCCVIFFFTYSPGEGSAGKGAPSSDLSTVEVMAKTIADMEEQFTIAAGIASEHIDNTVKAKEELLALSQSSLNRIQKLTDELKEIMQSNMDLMNKNIHLQMECDLLRKDGLLLRKEIAIDKKQRLDEQIAAAMARDNL